MVNLLTKEDYTNNDTTNLLSNGLGLLLNKLSGDERAETVVKETFAKVERAKQEWESTVDALPELICIVDDNGRVVRTNRTVEKWGLGNVKRVIGTDYHSLIHPFCSQPCYLSNAIHQSFNQTSIIEQEMFDEIMQRFISVRVQPVSMDNGHRNGSNNFVVILKDISVRKQAEQAMQRQNGRLVILNAINKAILAADSPKEIARAALKRIQTLVPYQHAHLLIKSPDTDRLIVLAVMTNGAETQLESGQEIAAHIIFQHTDRALNKFFIIQAISRLTDPVEIEEHWLAQALNCYMNVPLKAGSYNIL
jgi:PAS domain S-box-containing protein